ncbi:hemicentin-2-like [Tropilaelaps mercedesae]|uniref:Hemicentin-2-like n=1 Tax=Tropilaelaps mercedesae TaxID=418985 RepID=A0A1V9XSZ2_9ACAR|nr:hemicentin-2-like [Tropilaelaps mercedesae]
MQRLKKNCLCAILLFAIATRCVSSNLPQIAPLKIPDHLEEGQRLAIMCAVMKGSQPISFSWRKDNVPIVPSEDIKIAHNDYQETLQIVKLTAEHVGNYSCSVKNLHGSDQVSVNVLLQFSPRWILVSNGRAKPNGALTVEAIAGNGVRIDCRAFGHPVPSVAVYKGKYFSNRE